MWYYVDVTTIVAYLSALIGGVVYASYSEVYALNVALVTLGLIAFPAFKKAWKEVMEFRFKE